MIDKLSRSLIDGMPTDQVVDLKPAYTDPIPIRVIARMVGIPPDSELEARFKQLADTIAQVSDVKRFQEKYGEINAAVEELSDHFAGLIAERRARPAEDMLTYLIAQHEGDSLSAEELNSLLLIIILQAVGSC